MIEWKKSVLSDDATIREAIENLNLSASRIVLVVDVESRFVGVVVDGDVRRGLLKGITLDDSVLEIVNVNPEIALLGSSLVALEPLAISKGISHLPIVDSDRRLCGLHSFTEPASKNQKDNLFVIMAGGFGRRLHPHTESTAKPMLVVGEKPILEHLIDNVKKCGFEKILIAVHYLADSIESYFGDGRNFGVQISYLRETKPLGTAGALSLITDSITSPILISNADLVSTIDFGALLEFHNANGADATLAVRDYEWQNPFGVVELDDGRVTGIREKPRFISRISSGVYVINPTILNLLETNEALDMPELVNRAISHSYEIGAFLVHEDWSDIANESDLFSARENMIS